jgi:polysaccharide biosynthesis transport protein
MKPHTKVPAPSGFGIHDVIYIIFKHKWKIILLSMIGFAIAGAMIFRILQDPTYASEAKLMVRYVVERSTIDPEAGDRMMSGGLGTEVEILMSRDTAIEVAAAVGPEKLMPEATNPPTAAEAAARIQGGLEVECPPGTANMIYLKYRDSDSKLATEVLNQVVQTYFKKHLDFHRSTEAFSQVSKQTDEARSKLRLTEEEINQLKEKSGVLTIEATMKEFESRKSSIRESILAAQSQLAEQTAKVASLQKVPPKALPVKDDSSGSVGNGAGDSGSKVNSRDDNEAKRARTLAVTEYNSLAQRLLMLQERRNELLVNRKPNDPMVVSLDRQLAQVQARGLDLMELYPDLAGKVPGGSNRSGQTTAPLLSLEEEIALESAYKARLESVMAQAKALDAEVTRISSLGFQLQDLERRRSLEEDKYRYFQSSLEKARLDETLDPSKIPNISIVENPTPPSKSIDDKALKLIAGIAFSGLAAGLALAFLIEMVIDRRVSRPVEIHSRLQLPLMLSIPYIRSKDGIAKLLGDHAASGGASDSEKMILSTAPKNQVVSAEQAGEHFIAPYVAAIHDRVIFNFQVNNITHKPKLVALTGLSQGAGTSTLAAGLAKAFAENRGQKVLLVDLNAEPSVTQINPAESLYKALQMSRSEQFRQAPRNLYFADASTRRDSRNPYALAPTALQDLMPHLVASDFDYIVFDMPPIGPTSPTLTMAGFMDKVLLVLDGDNTTKEHLSWGYTELERAKADVSCIFNKARSHAPRWVQGEV